MHSADCLPSIDASLVSRARPTFVYCIVLYTGALFFVAAFGVLVC